MEKRVCVNILARFTRCWNLNPTKYMYMLHGYMALIGRLVGPTHNKNPTTIIHAMLAQLECVSKRIINISCIGANFESRVKFWEPPLSTSNKCERVLGSKIGYAQWKLSTSWIGLQRLPWPTHPSRTNYKASFNTLPPFFGYRKLSIKKTWMTLCQFS